MNRLIAGQQAHIEELEAEITRLRSALEIARRDALEEAAGVTDKAMETALESFLANGPLGSNAYRFDQSKAIGAAIRALIQPNTSPS